MKKTFKFFMCAAIVAAGFVGCSSEEVTGGTNGGGPVGTTDGEETTATFNLSVEGAPKVRATATDMETGALGQDVVTINNIRLLIFNSNNQLEVNKYYDSSTTGWDAGKSATVKLKSGQKQIFVSANESTDIKTILDGLSDLVAAPTSPAMYADFLTAIEYPLGGSGGKTGANHTDSLDFVGGSDPQFDITKAMGANFFLSSAIDANATKILKGRIEDTDSRNPPAGQEEEYNNFTIKIQRAVAKGVVFYENKANILTTLDGLGNLQSGTLQYGIDNVNLSLNLFQQFAGSTVKSAFYDIPNWANDGLRARFYPYFYKDYKLSNDLLAGTQGSLPSTTAVYFTENSKAVPYNANTTYAAIEGVFVPADGKWIDDFTFSASLNQATLVFGTGATAGDLYALKAYREDLNVSNGTYKDLYLFKDEEIAKKALYLILNGNLTGWTSSWDPTTEQAKNIDKYIGGECYYRLDIGQGLGAAIDCVVKRNAQYQMMITGFKTIGVNDRRKLDDKPWEPKPQDTYVTATIVVEPWDIVQGGSEV